MNLRLVDTMLKVHPDRPLLGPGIAPGALDTYYWYAQELVAYCRKQGLSTQGHKHEVLERVRYHLFGGLVMAPREPVRAKVTHAATGARTITLETRIGPDYKCDTDTRTFFESAIGPHFHFTAHLQRFRRANTHRQLTYGDLAVAWNELRQSAGHATTPAVSPAESRARLSRKARAVNPNRALSNMIDFAYQGGTVGRCMDCSHPDDRPTDGLHAVADDCAQVLDADERARVVWLA